MSLISTHFNAFDVAKPASSFHAAERRNLSARKAADRQRPWLVLFGQHRCGFLIFCGAPDLTLAKANFDKFQR